VIFIEKYPPTNIQPRRGDIEYTVGGITNSARQEITLPCHSDRREGSILWRICKSRQSSLTNHSLR